MSRVSAFRIAAFIVCMSLLLMAWHLFAPDEPTPYDPAHNIGWGVSFYHRLPIALQLLGLTLFLTALAWAYLAPLNPTRSTRAILNPESWPASLWRWLPFIIALIGVLLFTVFPSAYSEGDSSLFNRLSSQRIIIEAEPLDYYLKNKLYQILPGVLTQRTDAFQVMAVVSGFFYLLAAFLLSSRLGRSRRETLIFLAGLLSIAGILFFFRYIEVYAFVTAASLFLIWACLRYIDGKLPLNLLAAIAMFTTLFHGSGVFWLPMIAAAWLFHTNRSPLDQRWRLAIKEAIIAILIALLIIALFVTIIVLDGYTFAQFQDKVGELGGKGSGMFVPFFPYAGMPEPYAFFSWNHLGAVIQQQLLSAPMALITIAILLIFANSSMLVQVLRRPTAIFLATGAAGTLIFSILWNPDLGPRNDWDLLALPALPLTLLALYLLLQLPEGRPKRLALTSYLALSFVHTLGWLLIHILHIGY